MSVTSPTPSRPVRRRTAEGPARRGRVRKVRRFSGRDRVVVSLMLGIPAAVVVLLVWLPALFTVVLSFARWRASAASTPSSGSA
jgi:multiple sugar transport system permease protein